MDEMVGISEGKNQVYSLTRAAVTNYHKLGGLKQQIFLSDSPAGQKSEIRASAGPCSLPDPA